MAARLLSLLLSLLAAGAVPAAHAALDRAAFIGLAASVLQVEAPRSAGGFSLGSGVAVGSDTVVTNCHVTREAGRVSVVRDGVRWDADTQASNLARDLCLLHVPGLHAPAVALGRAADLAIGQAVTALGFTGGIGLQHSSGEVLELHRFDGSRVIQSSNWFSSGASGGGLFDDAGHLVGILTFRLRGGAAHYFAAPAEWVRDLVDAARQGALRRVRPLDSRRVPYWQADGAAQPPFLRAAVLLRDDRWSELEAVADAWSRADPADGEAWFLLGEARQRLGRLPEARQALECALQADPQREAARRALAEVAAVDPGSRREAAVPCRPGPT